MDPHKEWKAKIGGMKKETFLDEVFKDVRDHVEPLLKVVEDKLDGTSSEIARDAGIAAKEAVRGAWDEPGGES